MAQVFCRLFRITLNVFNDFRRQLLNSFEANWLVFALQVVLVNVFYLLDVIAFWLLFQSETLTAPHIYYNTIKLGLNSI